jgi:hypothetical protein
MRKLHAFAALAFLLIVALACKRSAPMPPMTADASLVAPITPSIMTAADPAVPMTPWKVGDTVDVEWSGTWYEAQILAVLPSSQYKIHYVGWGSNYDETVGPSRMRARVGGSAPSSTIAATTTTTSSAKPPPKDTTDHFSKCNGADGWASAPYNACVRDCASEKDCSKPCLGDWVISSCSECTAGQSCIQVQHQMQDGPGWSKGCVGKTAKGCPR